MKAPAGAAAAAGARRRAAGTFETACERSAPETHEAAGDVAEEADGVERVEERRAPQPLDPDEEGREDGHE